MRLNVCACVAKPYYSTWGLFQLQVQTKESDLGFIYSKLVYADARLII